MNNNALVKIAENVDLREGTEGVKAFFRVVYQNQGISTKETAKKLKMPIPIVAAIKQEAIKEDLIEAGATLRLSELGLTFCQEELGLELHQTRVCSNCEGVKYVIPQEFSKIIDKFIDIIKERPGVDVTVDQAHATPETSFRRALLALEKGLLFNKKIAFIGDDDYISIAIILLWQELYGAGGPELVVFDIDKRILKHIEETAKSLGYVIKTVCYDVRGCLPEEHLADFDVIFTDPPYTIPGADVFLLRASQLLKSKIGLNVIFSFGQKPPKESYQLQNKILEKGFCIEEIITGFNEYLGAAILGNVGQLMVLSKATDKMEKVQEIMSEIYTHQK